MPAQWGRRGGPSKDDEAVAEECVCVPSEERLLGDPDERTLASICFPCCA